MNKVEIKGILVGYAELWCRGLIKYEERDISVDFKVKVKPDGRVASIEGVVISDPQVPQEALGEIQYFLSKLLTDQEFRVGFYMPYMGLQEVYEEEETKKSKKKKKRRKKK